MTPRSVLTIIILLLLAYPCYAVPTTMGATMVGSNNVTASMSGAATTCWFEWGVRPGANTSWNTPNQTPSGGLCNTTIRGSPLVGNQQFYYRACDVTGCGSSTSFTTAAVTVIPTPTYGNIFDNATANNFDVLMMGEWNIAPYMWLVPGFEALIWGLIWMFVLVGLWLRGRDMTGVIIAGFIVGVVLFTPAYGLAIGIPREFAAIGQGIAYASIAGGLLVLIKK